MFKTIVTATLLLLALTFVGTARADDTNPLGAQIDVGVPDGAAAGLVVRPQDWLRLNASITYNAIAPGVRGGITLDPIDFGIAPTMTAEAGFSGQGKVPGGKNTPDVGYDYINLHLGLEFGNRHTWRFFLHGGPTYIHLNTGNFQNTVGFPSGLIIGNPTANVWFTPTVKLGFALFF